MLKKQALFGEFCFLSEPWMNLIVQEQPTFLLIKKLHGEHCLVDPRGGSLNKEASWRALLGGAQGGEV